MQVTAENRKWHHRFVMTSLPVEESPSKMVVRLRIKYNKTTIVLNILHLSVLLKKVMHCLVAVAFFFFLGGGGGAPCTFFLEL